MKKFLLVASSLTILIACKKGPGIGGQASINGKVYGWLYNKFLTAKIDSGYVGNYTVNIIYGDDLGVDANVKTDYTGAFSFLYLRTGHYKVFVYSRAHKTNQADSALVQEIDITSKKQVLTLADFRVIR